jgi:hypothetical protein
MKYINYKNGLDQVKTIIWSENIITHKSMMDCIKNVDSYDIKEIVSAGFIERGSNGKLKCFGKSYSLDVESNPLCDNILINLALSMRDPCAR